MSQVFYSYMLYPMGSFTKHLLVAVVFILLLPLKPYAQQYVEVGNGTTYGTYPGYYGPWGNYWENCHTQTLYLASDLGSPKKLTQLGWNFERITTTGSNYLLNVTIRIKETALTSFPAGAYQDMSGATTVFSASSFVPATATGWRIIDIADYIWFGTNNLIIDVLWGDNGYYASTYYRTYKTSAAAGINRMIIGYADSETPPNYDNVSIYYDNMRFYYQDLTLPGDLDGYVFNYYGLPIAGATVEMPGYASTLTGPNGYYFLDDILSGDQEIIASKVGYNSTSAIIYIPEGGATTYNFILTQPNMVISPLFIEQTLNPNEYYTTNISILNNGSGPLGWMAEIVYPPTAYPQYSEGETGTMIAGKEPDPLAFDRTGSNDQVRRTGSRDVGDVLSSFVAPVSLPWGIAHDGRFLWLTNPNSPSTIVQVTEEGALTGETIPANFGGSWVGDMACDGEYLYACNVGGDNGIKVIDLESGALVTTITGAWTVTSQRGLAYDAENEEFYIGGWNSDLIWRVTSTGATISTFSYAGGVSGLEWHPQGGPGGNGSLWMVENSPNDFITELDPNAGWITLQQFVLPGSTDYCGAGAALGPDGTLWAPCQCDITVYNIDLAEPFSGAGNWLTMAYYEGNVPGFGGVNNIPTNLDASGMLPGEVYTANIVFTSDPYVGTISVPVTMIIAGNPLFPPDDLEVALVNDILGQVSLTWTWTPEVMQYFLIKRDGAVIGTTTNQYYMDFLPDYGSYCYTVQAVYDEGTTAPAGPECVEWPNPVLFVDPDELEGWVWAGYTVDVYTIISNLGEGTLMYTFPEFVALNLVNNPNIEQNKTRAPFELREEETKGEDAFANRGYPVVLGAGGPDSFGYVWIDSDETGGPTFDWIDITATGVTVPTGTLGDDGKAGPYPMGFVFPFYDQPKTQFWVASNGCVGFNSNYHTFSNIGIPTNNASYVDFIAMFWDDLYSTYTSPSTVVLYQNFPDYTIVQWNDAARLSYSAYRMDMQVIMYKNGRIKIQYRNIDEGFALNSATVGIQAPSASIGLQVSFNTAYVHNDLALIFSLPADFIVDVQPPMGFVSAGGSQEITITYDSQDYEPGDYEQDLVLESNDPSNPEYIIDNTMHVYVPAQFAGTVTNNNNGAGIGGVTVTAGGFQATTAPNGTYSLLVDEGTYDVIFEKLGFQTMTVADTFALAGVVTPVSIGMWDQSYAPGFVHAEVMDEDTWCEVTWSLPEGPYEIQMDDGSAEDLALWSDAGSQNAVKFTPAGYPATVIGGRFYVGDGNFPAGGFLGTEFGVVVYDDDGANGLPGTMLDSVGVTVNNYGWVSLDWLNATIEDGSFYLAMYQTKDAPAAPLGVDLTLPTYYKSYSKFQGGGWLLSAYQDFMIRAYVSGPQTNIQETYSGGMKYPSRVQTDWATSMITRTGQLPRVLPDVEKAPQFRGIQGMSSRDVSHYLVARYSDFDPNGSPELGTTTELATQTDLAYEDYAWAGLPQGWYAYGVKALYTSGQYSPNTISNIVGHLIDFKVTVNCILTTGLEPVNIHVILQGLDYPYETFQALTPSGGTVIFDPVWKGNYYFTAFKIGYDVYEIPEVFVFEDMVMDVILGEKKYPSTNLYVDPKTLIATWNEPLITAVEEDFEGMTFPPAGWQSLSEGIGWEQTEDGSSTFWTVPPGDGFYAVSNDDQNSGNNGCCDYLITPMMDLRVSEDFAFTFDSYYDGMYGEIATVEYSLDAGATWEILTQLSPAGAWTEINVDISAFVGVNGPESIWFAFHADDAGAWASGWAIDNVRIWVLAPPAAYMDYFVFLDDAFVGSTTMETWDYAPLTYGVTYKASVAARYSSGLAEKDYYTFDCRYLFPPLNLSGTAPDDAAILEWEPPVTYTDAPQGMSYREYVDMFDLVPVNGPTAPSAALAPNMNPVELPGVPVIGRDVDSKAWAYDALGNFSVTFTLNQPGTLNPLGGAAPDFIAGADIVEGVYYGHVYGGTWLTMDTATGAYTIIGGTTDMTGIAYDFTTDVMYGVDFNGNLYTVDLATGATTLVGSSGAVMIDMACDNAGNLYGFDIGIDVFGSIDKATGAFTTIAPFPFDGNYAQGAGADHSVDMIYHAAYNNGMGAGQLYIVDQLTGSYTLVGNFEGNTEVDGFAGPDATACCGGGEIPENLLGYNLYRNGGFVNYIEYPDTLYVDQGLQPGIYAYTITGVYDLAPYGMPGETDESMEEGPAMITVDYCFELEFMESWDLGNFDANSWNTDSEHWVINGQAGNPAPSVEFTWDPIATDYAYTLESYPMCAVDLTEGKIWMDFDLKLENFNATGEEMLHAQVWSWDSQSWTTAATYSNVDGSFDWTSEHLNITFNAMSKVFRIRFLAMGANSLNILSWNVDNIHIYRLCDAPANLTAELEDIYIRLDWISPVGGAIAEWIQWDDGTNYTAIGTNSAVEFDVAARWEPTQLANYEGAAVTQVAFFPSEALCSYNIRIWVGAGAANMVVDQPVASPVIGEWNYVALDTPVPIDITQELWVGYYVNAQTGYPAGTDDGPAIDGYGNMMNFGGWQTLLQINPELDYNWNVQAYVESMAGAVMPLGKVIAPAMAPEGLTFAQGGVNTSATRTFNGAVNGSRVLTGFNVWKSVDGGEWSIIDFTTEPTYLDLGPFIIGEYPCYRVQAVYQGEEGGDYCESALSNEDCIITTSTGNPDQATFSLYPNPATDRVMIASSDGIDRVTVYNVLGQLVNDQVTNGSRFELNTANYQAGIYMIRVETAGKVETRTLTIQR